MEDRHNFVRILYGDSQEAVLNAWCPNAAFLRCVRKKCNCPQDIDLVTSEGEVQNLRLNPSQYANDVLTGRETYMLVQVDKSNGTLPKYTPLVNNVDELYPELNGKLENLSRPSAKTKRDKWSTASKKEKASRFIKRDSTVGKKKSV